MHACCGWLCRGQQVGQPQLGLPVLLRQSACRCRAQQTGQMISQFAVCLGLMSSIFDQKPLHGATGIDRKAAPSQTFHNLDWNPQKRRPERALDVLRLIIRMKTKKVRRSRDGICRFALLSRNKSCSFELPGGRCDQMSCNPGILKLPMRDLKVAILLLAMPEMLANQGLKDALCVHREPTPCRTCEQLNVQPRPRSIFWRLYPPLLRFA